MKIGYHCTPITDQLDTHTPAALIGFQDYGIEDVLVGQSLFQLRGLKVGLPLPDTVGYEWCNYSAGK